jgi:hypothetical protein
VRDFALQKRDQRLAPRKKDKLVESMNPDWRDPAADWCPEGLLKDGVTTQGPSALLVR